jgi:hypothetical protein
MGLGAGQSGEGRLETGKGIMNDITVNATKKMETGLLNL